MGTEYQTELVQWCRWESINVDHAILVVGVSEDLAVGQIEDALQAVKCWGQVRVRGRKFSSNADGLLGQCEYKEAFDPGAVPPEVIPVGSEEIWKIVIADQSYKPPTSDTFLEKLKVFLNTEGKTVADLKGFCDPPVSPTQTIGQDPVIPSLADAISHANKSQHESQSYRCLRVFPASLPPRLERNLWNTGLSRL